MPTSPRSQLEQPQADDRWNQSRHVSFMLACLLSRGEVKMRKVMGAALAAAMLSVAGIAYADNLEGTVEQIDRDRNKMTVDGQIFDVSEVMTAGDTLDDLKEGDKVNVQFTLEGSGDEDDEYRALQVDKISE
jgi:uncharacterized protein (DUF2147 family)